MTDTLLHLDSSVSGADSVSRRLTASFAETWRAAHDNTAYRYRDLAEDPVPLLGPGYASLGRRAERVGAPLTDVPALIEDDEERHEWELTRPLIDEVREAGTILLGVPMYNFSVPASLKAWIDRLTFPGLALPDTQVVVVTARGGAYGPGSPRQGWDFQEPYLRMYFANLGVSEADLTFVHAELTRADDIPALAPFRDLATASLREARAAVGTLAARPAARSA